MAHPLVAIYRVRPGDEGTEFLGYGTLVDSDFVLAHSAASRVLSLDLPEPSSTLRVRCWLNPAAANAMVLDATAVPSSPGGSRSVVGIALDWAWTGDFSNLPLTGQDSAEKVAAEAARIIAREERDDPNRPPSGGPGAPQTGGEPGQPTDKPWWCTLCPTSPRCR